MRRKHQLLFSIWTKHSPTTVLSPRLETCSPFGTGPTFNQSLIGAEHILRFVAPTVEPGATNFLRRLRIGIAGDVDGFAAKIHARRKQLSCVLIKGTFVTHSILHASKLTRTLCEVDFLICNNGFARHRAIQTTSFKASSPQYCSLHGNLRQLNLIFVLR